jgi:hypothetical protein
MEIRTALATFKSSIPRTEEVSGPKALPTYEITSKYPWNLAKYHIGNDVFAVHSDFLLESMAGHNGASTTDMEPTIDTSDSGEKSDATDTLISMV